MFKKSDWFDYRYAQLTTICDNIIKYIGIDIYFFYLKGEILIKHSFFFYQNSIVCYSKECKGFLIPVGISKIAGQCINFLIRHLFLYNLLYYNLFQHRQLSILINKWHCDFQKMCSPNKTTVTPAHLRWLGCLKINHRICLKLRHMVCSAII